MELNTIYNEDCLEGMKRIPQGSIDLTVTSPPYDNLRSYNGCSTALRALSRPIMFNIPIESHEEQIGWIE